MTEQNDERRRRGFSMDFVLYSTDCGWDIEKSTYHDYCNKLNKSGIHWYTKKSKAL